VLVARVEQLRERGLVVVAPIHDPIIAAGTRAINRAA